MSDIYLLLDLPWRRVSSRSILQRLSNRFHAVGIFQRGEVSRILIQIGVADDAPHDLRVARLWKVVEKFQNFRLERFTQLLCDRGPQFFTQLLAHIVSRL